MREFPRYFFGPYIFWAPTPFRGLDQGLGRVAFLAGLVYHDFLSIVLLAALRGPSYEEWSSSQAEYLLFSAWLMPVRPNTGRTEARYITRQRRIALDKALLLFDTIRKSHS